MTITVYTTSSCPYCVAAKDLLERKGLKFKEIDVTSPERRLMLLKKAQGRKTVPQIFIGGLHVGGYDDLLTLDQSGELGELIAAGLGQG